MKEKPFEYSNEQVLAGLTEKGTGRAFLITGKDRSWQKEELGEFVAVFPKGEGGFLDNY